MADEKPIIVLKKKGGHGGHHGGAWKVAYADFVTAMMCFFMVMWLINSADSQTRQNIAQYFKRPGLFEKGSGAPLLTGGSGFLEQNSAPYKKSGKKFAVGNSAVPMKKKGGTDEALLDYEVDEQHSARGIMKGDEDTKGYGVNEPEEGNTSIEFAETGEGTGEVVEPGEASPIEQLAQEIRQQIAMSPELQQLLGEVDVKVGADGLHIEIMDTEQTSMFDLGSARIRPETEAAFHKLADILKKLPNTIDIVGHTDAKPFKGAARTGYSNWELSSDRANAARRLLEESGIPPERFTNILGRADREPKNASDPLAASNRRITLTIKFPIDQKVDLGKNPSALEQLPSTPSPSTTATGKQRTRNPSQPPKAAEEDKVHSMTPKDILKNNTKKQKSITLPNENSPTMNPSYMEKDKIFGDNPVIGPPSLLGYTQ